VTTFRLTKLKNLETQNEALGDPHKNKKAVYGSALEWKAGSRPTLKWCISATLLIPPQKVSKNYNKLLFSYLQRPSRQNTLANPPPPFPLLKSMTFWVRSGSSDPWFWQKDPDLQDQLNFTSQQKTIFLHNFFCLLLFEGTGTFTVHHFSKIKKSKVVTK